MSIYDPRLVSRVCHMYYHQQMSQVDIADRLRLSRFQIGRIIRRALEEGYVTIHVSEPEPIYADLAAQIEDAFDLKVAILVDNNDLDEQALKHRVGSAAARYLTNILQDDDVLGISLGSTVRAMVESMPDLRGCKAVLVQLVGGGPNSSDNATCDAITWEFASKLDADPYLLYAPAVVDSKRTRQALLADSHIAQAYQQYRRLSIAVVGIGALASESSSRLVREGNIGPSQLDRLIRQGAVGDILAHVYDAQGQIVPSDLEQRAITIPLDDLVRTPTRIALAAGATKVQALLGALRGGFVNVLVTDQITAAEVLQYELGE